VKKHILFLADRNVLIDQTMVNDFRPFGAAMAKLSTSSKTIERDDGSTTELTTAIDRQRRIDTAYEIYLGLYQAITGPEERQKLFREFSPGFFDLIVIDECHRGSAAEDSAWREILDYFTAATQIGLTATPRETAYVSNIHYFGTPVYTYSLKQGIRDGFLAPYKVIKVHLDVDVEGYRPRPGETDQQGYEIEDYGYQLGRHWGIGQKEKNSGALLIVVPSERKVRIEVGYGLEGQLTDAVSRLIIQNAIAPRFKAGDYAGGINRGVDDIIQALADPDEWRQRAKQRPDSQPIGFDIVMAILLVIVVIMIMRSVSRGNARDPRSAARRGTGGPWRCSTSPWLPTVPRPTRRRWPSAPRRTARGGAG